MSSSYASRRYTSHDGISLHYRDYPAAGGEGPDSCVGVVLCLPGLTRNCKDFAGLATHLAGHDWRVLTPDLRGRGQSGRDPNWRHYLPPTNLRDIWTLLDHVGVERVVVVGTSLGGHLAMVMADQQPERLRAVVLNDVGPAIAPGALARIRAYVGKTPAQRDWGAAAAAVRETYSAAFPGGDEAFWLAQTRKAWTEREDGAVVPDYDPALADATRSAARATKLIGWLPRIGVRRVQGFNLDPWDNFRQLTMPTLLLRGMLSDVLTADTVARMQAVAPALELVEIPGRGHAPTLDEPLARAAIDEFLAGLRG